MGARLARLFRLVGPITEELVQRLLRLVLFHVNFG